MRGTRKNRRAKARQASKLEEIRQALIAAGCDTTAKQAAALGVGRSTAWALLNLDKRAGPTAIVIKRILVVAGPSAGGATKIRRICRGEDRRPVWA